MTADVKCGESAAKRTSSWLVGAASAYWLSWLLMPGVGVIGVKRGTLLLLETYRTSVPELLRVASALAYAHGLTSLVRFDHGERAAYIRIGSTFILLGAIGSSVGGLLRPFAPGIFAMLFFAGHGVLVPSLRNGSSLARFGVNVLLMTPIVAALGWCAIRYGVMPRPFVGLALMGTVTSSLALLGISARNTLTSRNAKARPAAHRSQ